MFKKSFSLWLIPSTDGKARKFRFTLKTLLIVTLVVSVTMGVFVAVLGDYGRLQFVNLKYHQIVRILKEESSKLRVHNEDLNHELKALKQVNSKMVNQQQSVKKQLDELSSVLKGALGHEVVKETDNSKDFSRSGLGGGEIPCLGTCVKRSNYLRKRNYTSSTFLVRGRDMTTRLDSYITFLRLLPIGYPAYGQFSSGFGSRISPFTGGYAIHQGLDIQVPNGTKVRSTGGGSVRGVRFNREYGLHVDIRHKGNIVTRYAHLSRVNVMPGDRVERGNIIALSGSTGRTTGAHLHYEVRMRGKALDPMPFIQLASKLSKFAV